MFGNARFQNMLKPSSAAGLQVTILPDGNFRYRLVILKKNQSALTTELQSTSLKSLAQVKQKLDPKIPLVIVLDGKGIVYRKVYAKENESSTVLLSKLLPNANADDFVMQRTSLNEEEMILSVIRLSVFTELMNELIANGLTSVADVYIGPVVLTNILQLLDKQLVESGYLHVDQFGLKINEQQVTDIELTSLAPDEDIRIGNDRISRQLLIAFAAALTGFVDQENTISNSEMLSHVKSEFKQKQKFERRGWTVLVTVFVLLIVNYLVFNNYWSQNKEMTMQLQLAQTALQRYEKLKLDFDQKKQFLEQNGLLESSRTSYYADELAKELPASIQFTGLNIHPQKKKKPGEEETTVSFQNKLIYITGNCSRNTELNEWMKKIKKKTWVQELVLLNYKQANIEENGVFLIEVKLN